MSRNEDGQASGPRATLALLALGALTLIIACVAIRDAVLWYSAPTPGLLVEPGGAVSNVGLPHWAGRRAGLQYPSRIAQPGEEHFQGGSRAGPALGRGRRSSAEPTLSGLGGRYRTDECAAMPMTPLEPLPVGLRGHLALRGFLYTSAALIALWPSARWLSRASRRSLRPGLFLFSFFDIHTERTLTPVSSSPTATCRDMIVLLANLPEPPHGYFAIAGRAHVGSAVPRTRHDAMTR